MATSLLIIVALYQVFDDVQVIAMGALRGYKDTAKPFLIAFACYWLVSFPVALILGYGYFEPKYGSGWLLGWSGQRFGVCGSGVGGAV